MGSTRPAEHSACISEILETDCVRGASFGRFGLIWALCRGRGASERKAAAGSRRRAGGGGRSERAGAARMGASAHAATGARGTWSGGAYGMHDVTSLAREKVSRDRPGRIQVWTDRLGVERSKGARATFAPRRCDCGPTTAQRTRCWGASAGRANPVGVGSSEPPADHRIGLRPLFL